MSKIEGTHIHLCISTALLQSLIGELCDYMLMNASVICKHCNINISPTPHAQTLWCHGCGRIISVCRYQETWKQGKVVSETKFYKHSLRQRFSEDNCQKSSITSTVKYMHSETISSWEAPRGKRALLCGVVYSKQKYRLKGTFNDVNNMRHMLVEHFKFPSSSIHILTGITLFMSIML